MLDMWLEQPAYEPEDDLYCPTCNVVINTPKGFLECRECLQVFSWEDFEKDFSEDESICF